MFLIAAFLAVFSCPASAQSWCGDRAKIVDELVHVFSERQVGVGIVNKGVIVEFLVSEGGKTWTIIATASNGVSCIIAAGENWQSTPLETPGTDSRLKP